MGGAKQSLSESAADLLRREFDSLCQEAAKLISESDVLLLCTGAGFSADSGLAIYADVARIPQYASRELTYGDICQPHWQFKEPELFWGFWGQCYNDYRDTSPHQGYEIINRWVDSRYRGSAVAGKIRKALEEKSQTTKGPNAEDVEVADMSQNAPWLKASSGERSSGDFAEGVPTSNEDPCPAEVVADARRFEGPELINQPQRADVGDQPYVVEDCAGAFFVFTSNVDAHHYDWFHACEIRECHGNTEIYQCAGDCPQVWRAPHDFRFTVDKTTMLAPADSSQINAYPTDAPTAVQQEGVSEEVKPRIGQTGGSRRTTTLRHMPPPACQGHAGFSGNHPKCPFCGKGARPAVRMFGDGEWLDLQEQENRWRNWRGTIADVAKATSPEHLTDRLRIVILEIGAGNNVKTVRNTSENSLIAFREAGADVRLVRVNPDFPLIDNTHINSEGVISVMGRGLEALLKIDESVTL